ncbi:MAG: retropepsin-like aspartic protease [Flavobacterium sp.]|uniref:retropepsin-like aspartic protease n=1 Tax=Flavobacterium sp. TaxID=239 RepID=UPI003BE4F5E0
MRKLFISIIFLINFSYGQAVRQDKTIRASMVNGYFTGIETALTNISELNPNFRSEVNQLNLLLTTNFGQSKKNAIKYLNGIDNWEDAMKSKMDSIKQVIHTNILFSTNEETAIYLKELEKNLKGNIPSPMLENILSFQYENQPSKEFSNGYTYTFNTKGHKKSKNTELILTIPKSWSSQEGKQPNVIQLFVSDCGNGSNSISILTQEMPYTKEEFGNLTFEEIDKLYKEDLFTEEYAKNFIDGKFISYKPMNIAGRAGFLVVYEVINEKMGMKIKMRNNAYIFHDVTYLHFINCGIGTPTLEENLEEKSNIINPLFFMIVNSIVVPKKNDDVINLKGTEYQKIIEIKISDKTYDFILDTGATISLIGKNIINNLLENGTITTRNYLGKDYIQTADGKKHLVEFWNIPSIIIDGKKIKDVDFTVMESGNIKPLLGMNILNKLNIYKIDLENYKIYLKK